MRCSVTSASVDQRNSNNVITGSASGSGCIWTFTITSQLPNLWTNIVNSSIGSVRVQTADSISSLYADSGVLASNQSITYNVEFSQPSQSVTIFLDPSVQTSYHATIINVLQGIIDGASLKAGVGTVELAIEDVGNVIQTIDQMPHFKAAIEAFNRPSCLAGICIPVPNIIEGTQQLIAFVQSPTEPGLLIGLLVKLGVDVIETGLTALFKVPGAIASVLLEIVTNFQTAFGNAAGSVILVAH